jgi:ribosome-associated protein
MKTPPKTKVASKAKALAKAPARSKATGKPAAKPAAKSSNKAKAVAKSKPKPGLGPKSKAVAKTAPKKVASKAKPKAAPAPKAKAAKAGSVDASDTLTALAVAALEDLKGVDIKILNVRDLTTIADAMVICTGTSNRHVKSLAENVVDMARQRGFRALGIEGLGEGEWVLVDLNGVLVHVMQAQTRLFYQLEKLWDMSQLDSKSA